MLFGRAGRFREGEKKNTATDNREFLVLPSVVSKAISPTKLVDPWVQHKESDLRDAVSVKSLSPGGSVDKTDRGISVRNDNPVRLTALPVYDSPIFLNSTHLVLRVP